MVRILLAGCLAIMLSSCIVKGSEFDRWKKYSAQNQENLFYLIKSLDEATGTSLDTGLADSSQKRLDAEAEKQSGVDWGGITEKMIKAVLSALMAQLGLGGLVGGGGLGATGLLASAYFYRKKRESDRVAHEVATQEPDEARKTLADRKISA